MHAEQKINIHNRFDIEVRDAITGELTQTAIAHNIVLNQMYNRLCTGQSYFGHIQFGTGTGSIIATRTSLFTHLGSKSSITDEIIKAVPVTKWKRKIVLNPEEYVGKVITEVGIAYDPYSTSLVTHAELKDSEGNPISINKTATDVVTIYATVFITFTNTVPSLILLGLPDTNTLINYFTGSGWPSGSFGLLPGEHAGNRLGSTPVVSWSADIPNRQIKTNVSRFGIDVANGHVKTIEFSNLFSLVLPALGIFEGQPYTNVPLGTGNGIITSFMIPSKNIIHDTISMKKNGVITTGYDKKKLPSINFAYPKLVSLPASGSEYIYGVGISGDGQTAVVGVEKHPYMVIYEKQAEVWTKQPGVIGSASMQAVAISLDGNVAVGVGWMAPHINIYARSTENQWIKRPVPLEFPLGWAVSIALSSDGSVMAVGHYNGPSYLTTYDWDGTNWNKRIDPSVIPTSKVGAVSLSSDGTVMVVCFDSSPYILTYDWDGTNWNKRIDPSVIPSGIVNASALSSDGTVMILGKTDGAFIGAYDWDGTNWNKRIDPPTPIPLGATNALALSADGTIMAMGGRVTPYISTYKWNDAEWLKGSPPMFIPSTSTTRGISMSADGNTLMLGHLISPYLQFYEHSARDTIVTFNTPPAIGEVIAADYTVEGIHKTNQYVIDASFAIQFGEGV